MDYLQGKDEIQTHILEKKKSNKKRVLPVSDFFIIERIIPNHKNIGLYRWSVMNRQRIIPSHMYN